MRKDIDHLPPAKRRDLAQAVTILRATFDAAIKGKLNPEIKAGRIEKIILYGSMARGTWRFDPGTGFRSDYDLLVVVSAERFTDPDWWHDAVDQLDLYEQMSPIRPPTNFVVHSLQDVNDQIARGRPFFADIRREGIIVYEASPKELARPGNLSEAEKREEAARHFRMWFPKIGSALRLAKVAMEDGEHNDAAFLLHQACERAYHCALLTLTLYSPKLHNIFKLRQTAGELDERIFAAWPRRNRRDKQVFELIVRAYVDARYSEHYAITRQQLDFAIACAERLETIVGEVCAEHLCAVPPPRSS